MDGVKKARIECCHECEHRISKHSEYAGAHGYSVFCTYGGERVELHDKYMEGPDSNCPLGRWSGLASAGPTDPEEWKAWNQKKNKDRIRREKKPKLVNALSAVAQEKDISADFETTLAVLVATGHCPVWLAEEILDERGD